jgi:hypothetical protein
MKPFIAALYALFIFAMASGIFVAYRNAEGLMESDYYQKGNGWFKAKTEERRLGLEVVKPESISTGSNEVQFTLSEHGKPLRKADVRLFIGNVSTKEHDFACRMQETAPGVYQTRAVVPTKGKWLLRMDLAAAQLNTSRSWFYEVK